MKYNNQYVSGEITTLNNNIINIKGSINTNLESYIIASSSPDNLINYSGSKLPFPNEEIAFYNTNNYHDIKNNYYNINFKYPNSYYCVDGYTLINPSIFFVIKENNKPIIIKVELPNNKPLKTLINRNLEHDPDFYNSKYNVLPVATAEQNMYNLAKYKLSANKA
tara:strand:- start:136 stop:630 length:495 start_codon:yes stop_codon:yes gene_type:complete